MGASLSDAPGELEHAVGPDGKFLDPDSAKRNLLVANTRLAAIRDSLPPLERVLFDRRQEALKSYWSTSLSMKKEAPDLSGQPRNDHLALAQAQLQAAQRELREGPQAPLQAIHQVFEAYPAEVGAVLQKHGMWRATEQQALEVIANSMETGVETVVEGTSRDLNATGTTNQGRRLSEYGQLLTNRGRTSPLGPDLMSLQPGQLYLDVGCGNGKAIDEAFFLGFSGEAMGVDPLTEASVAAQVMHADRYTFEKKPLDQVAMPKKATVMTDIYANLSYHPNFDQALQSELDRLETGGRLYAMMAAPLNYVVRADGTNATLEEWTAKLPGLEVTQFDTGGIMVKKLADDVKIPPLHLAGFSNGKPPQRVYYEPGYEQVAAKSAD